MGHEVIAHAGGGSGIAAQNNPNIWGTEYIEAERGTTAYKFNFRIDSLFYKQNILSVLSQLPRIGSPVSIGGPKFRRARIKH